MLYKSYLNILSKQRNYKFELHYDGLYTVVTSLT